MKNSFKLFILALISMWFSCTAPKNDSSKIKIVTTTGIIGDCLKEIIGDRAEVESLMGAGVDPHLYKASQGDMQKLTSADVIIYNGLHLEGKMAAVLSKMSNSKLAIAVGDHAPDSLLKRVDTESELRDPHIWFDPVLWMNCMQGVVEELSGMEGLEGIEKDYNKYREKVLAKHNEMVQRLNKELPDNKRILITSHDAFEYFGDAYEFQVRGLQGISTAAEYGIKDVKDLIEFVIQNDIKAVFIETSVSDKNLKAVVSGAKAQKFDLKIGGTLYSDALGNDGTPAGTYIGMLESNINTIIKGLNQ